MDSLRRLLLTSVLLVFGNQATRLEIAIMGAGSFALVQSSLKPYVDSFTNTLAGLSNAIIFVTFFIAFVLYTDYVPGFFYNKLGYILVTIVATIALSFAGFQIREVLRRAKMVLMDLQT